MPPRTDLLRGGRGGGRRPVRRGSLGGYTMYIVSCPVRYRSYAEGFEGKDNELQMTQAPSMERSRLNFIDTSTHVEVIQQGEGRMPIVD